MSVREYPVHPVAPPSESAFARLSADHPPVLLVLIDAEEEFDWSAPFDRGETAVTAISELTLAHGTLFDRHGIRPVYVCDYPVAADPTAAKVMRELSSSGRAVIGAHLHPWVTPPFDEEVGVPNSYPGNLPAELEEAKLETLASTIERNIGVRPLSYQAGRYGLGPHTSAILERAGFEYDFSPAPPFDFSAETGPDFSGFSSQPYWFGSHRDLLAIPITGAYVGFLGPNAHRVYRWATQPSLAWAHLPGVLSRARAIDRIRLSPEGFHLADLVRLTRRELERGVRVFTFSFHSPSLKPGCTAYVQNQTDLARFVDRCTRYFDFFMRDLGGVAMTPGELREKLSSPPRLHHLSNAPLT
jgi:hypothetical protein